MIRFALPLALATTMLGGCTTTADLPAVKLATATLKQGNGLPAGTAVLTAAGDTVTLAVAVAGLGAGDRGMHLHMVGRCDGPDFASAGGHLNPGGRQHGVHNPAGSHLGDLPNLTIGSDGTGSATATLPGTRAELEAALFDADGTAIIIHAAADDYKTDPAGNSGPRVVCGVLTRS
ncbi:MAG: superoxide dismutase family protein [Novosphingobium sp.]